MSSNRWIQFIKFGLVGVSNIAVSYTVNIWHSAAPQGISTIL